MLADCSQFPKIVSLQLNAAKKGTPTPADQNVNLANGQKHPCEPPKLLNVDTFEKKKKLWNKCFADKNSLLSCTRFVKKSSLGDLVNSQTISANGATLRENAFPQRKKSFDCVEHTRPDFALNKSHVTAFLRRSAVYSHSFDGKFKTFVEESFGAILQRDFKVKEAEWPLRKNPFALKNGLAQILQKEFVAYNVREVAGPLQPLVQHLSRGQLEQLDAAIEGSLALPHRSLMQHGLHAIYRGLLKACEGQSDDRRSHALIARMQAVLTRPKLKFVQTWLMLPKRSHASIDGLMLPQRFTRTNKSLRVSINMGDGSRRSVYARQSVNAFQIKSILNGRSLAQNTLGLSGELHSLSQQVPRGFGLKTLNLSALADASLASNFVNADKQKRSTLLPVVVEKL